MQNLVLWWNVVNHYSDRHYFKVENKCINLLPPFKALHVFQLNTMFCQYDKNSKKY